jgi:hypothetical protein
MENARDRTSPVLLQRIELYFTSSITENDTNINDRDQASWEGASIRVFKLLALIYRFNQRFPNATHIPPVARVV